MRPLLAALLVAWPVLAVAKVVNVEFQFTPFTGDVAKDEQVKVVAGTAHVALNGVSLVDQEVAADEVPVLFDEREVAPAVWVPVASLGAAVRKGPNTIRITFEPSDPHAPYTARLHWAAVTDQVAEADDGGTHKSTNQADEGTKDERATGPVTMERQFVADFAIDRPWHHAPAVTALTPDDEQQLRALLAARAKAFAPDFAALYAVLAATPGVDVAGIRTAKCVDAAYRAGVRIAPAPADQLEFRTFGTPEVGVRAKTRPLFAPVDPAAFGKIKGDRAQSCAETALMTAYPPRLFVVRKADGAGWQAAY